MAPPISSRSRIGRRLVAACLAVLGLAACVWWGVHPPRSEQAYRQESERTVELLRSHVETARLWADAVADDQVLRQGATVALTETSADADTDASSYSALDPPNHDATLARRRVTAVAERVVAVLGELRVAAHAGRWQAVVAARPLLHRLSARLDEVRRRVAP